VFAGATGEHVTHASRARRKAWITAKYRQNAVIVYSDKCAESTSPWATRRTVRNHKRVTVRGKKWQFERGGLLDE
jgi:hypothetical protein